MASAAEEDYILCGIQPETKVEKTDYRKLPCPLPYEEISREACMSLKLPTFEGLQADFTKAISQKFALTSNVYMGSMDLGLGKISPGSPEVMIKSPASRHQFGFHYIDDPKKYLVGQYMVAEGILTARGNWGCTDNLSVKVDGMFSKDPNYGREIAGSLEYKGNDWRSQIHMASNKTFIANYIQSVTPKLALGSEVFWSGEQRISGLAIAARYNTDKMVLTGKISSGGTGEFSYVQKVSDRVNLATDLTINAKSGDAIASVGYDYMLRQSRLRGKLDSNGRSSAYLEKWMSEGLKFLLSGQIDHKKEDYKFGLGLELGQ